MFNSIANTESMKKNSIMMGSGNDTIQSIKLLIDFLFDDFNSVIYTTGSDIETELNYLLYEICLSQDEFGGKVIDEIGKSIAKNWGYDIEVDNSIQRYSDFTKEIIEKVALDRIEEYSIIKCTQLVDPEHLKLYVISLDGVPTAPKCDEQKQRRVNGVIISELKRFISKECESSIPPIRKLYEAYKISFDRGKIISWTSFMKSVEIKLKSEDFFNKLQKVCPKLEKVVVSDQNIYGEGEKKIMEYICEHRLVGKYAIFSPDADVIMLGIIGQNKLNNGSTFSVIRYNQQSGGYDVIDIDMLRNNIFEYVSNKLKILNDMQNAIVDTSFNSDVNANINANINSNQLQSQGKKNAKNSTKYVTKKSVTDDIAFIFTLFGNDFIPRVESIDVRNNIETLMDIYCNVINRSDKKYFVYTPSSSSEERRINYFNLCQLISELANIEGLLLNETYMSNKYKNYRTLKKKLGVSRLLPVLREYVGKANILFQKLRQEMKEVKYVAQQNIDQLATINEEKIKSVAKNYMSDVEFMKQFLIFEDERYENRDSINAMEIYSKFEAKLIKIMNYFLKNGKDIRCRYILQTYDTLQKADSVLDAFHVKRITENFPHKAMEVTSYDIESYKLERKLGKYEMKLNASDFDLGAVNLSFDKDTGNCSLRYTSSENAICNYYDTFFGIKHTKKIIDVVKNGKKVSKKIIEFDEDKIVSLVEDYIKGLFWVFDCYFNKNDSAYNANFVSTWSYPYNRSPLMYQVKYVLNKYAKNGKDFIEKMNSLYLNVTSTRVVPRHKFMNKIEHYLFVTPYDKLRELPEKYKMFVEENRDMFPSIVEIAKIIAENDDNSKIIDCRRISFVNKCHLLNVRYISYDEFMGRISHLRDETEIPTAISKFEKVFVETSSLVSSLPNTDTPRIMEIQNIDVSIVPIVQIEPIEPIESISSIKSIKSLKSIKPIESIKFTKSVEYKNFGNFENTVPICNTSTNMSATSETTIYQNFRTDEPTNINASNKTSDQQNDNRKEKIKYYYEYFKFLYLKTRKLEYKRCYKILKKFL